MIGWLILVYDRTAEKRFPFKRKWYRFDYALATETEIEHVSRIVSRKPDALRSTASTTKPNDWQVMFELSAGENSTSVEILHYRHLFKYIPDEEEAFAEEEVRAGFQCVTLPTESYFEDENQEPITLTQVFDCEAQRESGTEARAIVYDQPESILRLAPVEPLRPELWSADDATLVAHLFDVYRQLIESRWLQSRCVVAPAPDGKCEAILPVEEDCRAIILPFRQLYSQDGMDDLYNRCCKLHKRHCPPTHVMNAWVVHYKRRFNGFLDEPPTLPQIKCSATARQYLDAFGYGAGMIHASSKKDTPAVTLSKLLEANPRELVVMGYHYILRTLLGCVSMTLPVIQKNVFHWENDLEWASKSRMSSGALFG